MSDATTPKIDDCEKESSPESHAVSSASSSEDAGHDLRISALLSAAAHIDPLKLITESSNKKRKSGNVDDLPVFRVVLTRVLNDEL